MKCCDKNAVCFQFFAIPQFLPIFLSKAHGTDESIWDDRSLMVSTALVKNVNGTGVLYKSVRTFQAKTSRPLTRHQQPARNLLPTSAGAQAHGRRRGRLYPCRVLGGLRARRSAVHQRRHDAAGQAHDGSLEAVTCLRRAHRRPPPSRHRWVQLRS